MKYSLDKRAMGRLLILSVALVALAALTYGRTTTTAVNIVNNSSKDIRSVYISHVNSDDWSANQLGDAVISAGHSFNLANVAWDENQVKIIGEDEDGCFVSTVVNCGDNSTWTITNETTRDCGGN